MEEQKPNQNITNFFGGSIVASSIIIACIVVAASVIAGSLIISHGDISIGSANAQVTTGTAPLPTTGVKVTDRSDEPSMGSASAPVTVYEFGDFQCPFCKQFFQQSFADIKTKYIDTGKVRFVFRHFPLTQIHVNAEISSEAAECANRQGKFEAYYDVLYTSGQADGTGLDNVSLKKYAGQVGLNQATFNQCLDNHETKSVVVADEALGTALGVNGTPSFFINGTLIPGAVPTATFEGAVESALKK